VAQVAKPERISDWELVFYRQLWEAGLRPIPQYAEETFLLDVAPLAEGRKLSIDVTPLPFSLDLEARARAPDCLPGPQLAEPIALGNLLAGVAVDRRLAARGFCTRITAIARGLPAGSAAGFSLVSTHLLRVSANAARGQQAR